jgi:glucan phosphoethanolaminetransferase (alkaline phosphatase superfamily)
MTKRFIQFTAEPSRYYRVLISLLYVAPVLVIATWATQRQAPRTVVAILITAILIAIIAAAITRSWRRFFLSQFLLFTLGVVYVAYTFTFSMPPAQTLAVILVNTSSEEIRGFIGISQCKWIVGLVTALTACYVWLAFKTPNDGIFAGRPKRSTRNFLMLMLIPTAYAASDSANLMDGIALNPTAGSLIFLCGWLPQAAADMRGARVHKVPYGARRAGGEEVHVLIVGESERRASWSVYGYHRATTPNMDKLKGEAIFLQHAIADANLTDWAVPIILTGLTPDEYEISRIRGNLIDLANEAGYVTSWLDNQDIGIAMSVGVTANYTVNPTDLNANINGRHTFDEVLLPAYSREIARGGVARFIGIHMMGAHWEYYRRYPPGFQRFGTGNGLSMLSAFFGSKDSFAEVVDSYDNAVLYTDWFLHEIIEDARRLQVPVSIMFVSDHGEDLQLLDGESGHGQPAYTEHAFDIPAFVWVNEAYRSAHPDRVSAIEKNASQEFRSHNVFDTEANLMGITWSGAQSAHSLASEHFVSDAAMKHVAGGVHVMRHATPPNLAQRGPSRPDGSD